MSDKRKEKSSAQDKVKTDVKIQVIPCEDKEDETVASFLIYNEDHTLGNSLRWMIMKNPDVEFCGYSVPHPSENSIQMRIQTYPSADVTAVEVLKKGLTDLMDLCKHASSTFQEAVEAFHSTHPEAMDTSASTLHQV